ncbi:MAG: efflux RND transporter periplasmic adaptor subunit [Chitinophagaceae bacterium]
MSKSLKWGLLIVGLLVIAFFVSRKMLAGDKTEKVATEKASRRTIIETVNASGKIYPETEVKITPEFSGQITELKVSEGDRVKKGQTLARISNRMNIEAPMNGIVTSLKVKKGESVAGNTFNVGTEIMTVADMSVLELRVDVGENDIVKVQVGDSADIEVDAYNNRKFKGVVTQIANSTKASPVSMTTNDVTNYEVRIRLDSSSYHDLLDSAGNNPFRRGMNASADIKTKKVENVLAVPIMAVNARVKDSDKSLEEKRKEDKANDEENETPANSVTDELEEVVFVLEKDNTVKKVLVKTGVQDINYIEITSGLQPGDEVVTGPYNAISKNLKNGIKVKVVPRDKLFEN